MPPFKKRGRGRPRKAKMYRGPSSYRSVMGKYQPTFSETWTGGALTVSGGVLSGQLNMAFNSLPQQPQYSALYRQYRILRNTWILVPRATSVDPNAANFNASLPTPPSSQFNGRFVYAINDTAGQVNPANEVTVLQSNGSKIRSTGDGKIIKITHVPIPDQDVASSTLVNRFMNKKYVWFNTAAATNSGPAIDIIHGGISFFITVPGSLSSQVMYDVYCKTYFQMKDPA